VFDDPHLVPLLGAIELQLNEREAGSFEAQSFKRYDAGTSLDGQMSQAPGA
jgi:hypothetical protein